MSNFKKQLIVVGILMCFLLNGCALLNVPLQMIGGTLTAVGGILKGAFELAKKLPMPPPGVF